LREVEKPVKMETDNRKVSDKHSLAMLIVGYYSAINTASIATLFTLGSIGVLVLVNIGATAILAILVSLALFFQKESPAYEREELARLSKKYAPTPTASTPTPTQVAESFPKPAPPKPTGTTHSNPDLPSSIKFDSNNNLA
jgi:amino acid transporter